MKMQNEHVLLYKVQYATIADAIRMIKMAGKGCFLGKTDTKNPFRLIPICPDDYNLLGIKWKGVYYCARCMPMGCSSSCKTFEAFSTAVEWIIRFNTEARADLDVWHQFLSNFNGKSFFLDDDWNTSSQLRLFIDASGSLGFGAVLETSWCYGAWPNK